MNRHVFFIVGVVVGAVGMAAIFETRPRSWDTAFAVMTDGKLALAVKPTGKVEYGPAYTTDTLQQLLDGLKKIRQQPYGVVDCHETGYRFPLGDPPTDGVIRIYPGTAYLWPPKPLPRMR